MVKCRVIWILEQLRILSCIGSLIDSLTVCSVILWVCSMLIEYIMDKWADWYFPDTSVPKKKNMSKLFSIFFNECALNRKYNCVNQNFVDSRFSAYVISYARNVSIEWLCLFNWSAFENWVWMYLNLFTWRSLDCFRLHFCLVLPSGFITVFFQSHVCSI